jgi:PEP-CTERM motif-containing protein
MTRRSTLGGLAAASVFAGAAIAHADPIQFGVVGSAIDLSANVSEAILPGGTVFQDSRPLLGTEPDPKQSAELLHLSDRGVNGSGRSTNISGAFASSLAESDGNGGVGVSQLLFGDPGGAAGQDVVRQLVGQSLWTQTFVYNGTPAVDVTLHLHIPALEVGLLGVAPMRDAPSATETAQAVARLDAVVTHADGTFSKGGSFEFGLRAFERQLISGSQFINFGDIDIIGAANPSLFGSLKFNGDDFQPRWTLDSVSTAVKLGTLQQGDTLSYVYTLTAEGTTHGFEHGYLAFLGDPFGVDTVGDNLGVTVALSDVPEPGTCALLVFGLAGLAASRKAARGIR